MQSSLHIRRPLGGRGGGRVRGRGVSELSTTQRTGGVRHCSSVTSHFSITTSGKIFKIHLPCWSQCLWQILLILVVCLSEETPLGILVTKCSRTRRSHQIWQSLSTSSPPNVYPVWSARSEHQVQRTSQETWRSIQIRQQRLRKKRITNYAKMIYFSSASVRMMYHQLPVWW